MAVDVVTEITIDRPGPRATEDDPQRASGWTFFSPALVKSLAAAIAEVHANFSSRAFTKDATAGLDELELLDRGKHIPTALSKHLPPAYPNAIEVLLRSLGPERGDFVDTGERLLA